MGFLSECFEFVLVGQTANDGVHAELGFRYASLSGISYEHGDIESVRFGMREEAI